MNFNESLKFSKEFKRLSDKYKSLPADLNEFKFVIAARPLGNNNHFNVITKNERCAIVKARFFCSYLRGSSLRVIYAYHRQSCKVEFIEIYFKGEKENEDANRIKRYLNKMD